MLVVLSSSTSAERLVRMLKRKNIFAEAVQTPKSISEGGCGYSVRVDEKFSREAEKAAKELRIAVKGLYDEFGPKNERSYKRRT